MVQYFTRLFQGRVNRSTYFFGSIMLEAIFIFTTYFLSVLRLSGLITGLINILLVSFLIVVLVSLVIRRCHDLGKPGVFGLLLIVPFVNCFIYIYLLFFPGMEDNNDFGPQVKGLDVKRAFGF